MGLTKKIIKKIVHTLHIDILFCMSQHYKLRKVIKQIILFAKTLEKNTFLKI